MRAIFKITLFFLLQVSFMPSTLAKSLKDFSPYEYDLRFTNPLCEEYKYEAPALSNSGKELIAKPKNVYCKKSDEEASAAQPNSPIQKLLAWINDETTTEIFFTYLSFSNNTVLDALCSAVVERDVKITFVLDSKTSMRAANDLMACKSKVSGQSPQFFARGHVRGIGFAHNKIFMVNPTSPVEVKIAFGSGNLTAGAVLHHENWHFVTTSPESYFARSHLCVADAEIHHSESGAEFKSYMKTCLEHIGAPPEDDIRPYYAPAEGALATHVLRESLDWATDVQIAAHRFSYTKLMKMLKDHLRNKDFKLDLVFDDDIFWVGEKFARNRPNVRSEYKHVAELVELGANAKYLETNHNYKYLHHNKFIIFKNSEKSAAFVGAGNFTGTAFTENFENFYFVQIPEVVTTLSEQYRHLYEDLATAKEDLPQKDILP
ncbi:MAG: hypothetical protein KDD38_01715 [Bdellovibrionales bacterium]|nr:hypothetical protein [Bdellovibrionales bacterium]